MVGAGVYVDEIEQVISQKKAVLTQQITHDMFTMLGVVATLLIGIYLSARYLADKVHRNFQTFATFFETAATTATNITSESLHFAEFERLAISANRMIDERKRIEEERKRAEAEIHTLNAELETRVKQRTAELEAANKELQSFAYIVSHDLKSPLRGICHIADWLVQDYANAFDDQGKEMLSLLNNRVKRMDNLIEGILEYSRIGRILGKDDVIDLYRLLKDIVDTLAPPPTIHLAIVPDLPVIVGDKTRLSQVFQNLIGNAIKFMDKPQGEIKIGCEDAGAYWQFSVTDNGPGIDPRHHERIFQIFQTLRPRDEQESTGIGLSIVKKIVEFYSGKVWVESEPGTGSTFWFTLPKVSPP
jgi:signal transduction histidine kinase